MKIEIPKYKGLHVDKIVCLNCNKKMQKNDSSVEINVSVWINGYIQTISASSYFCNDCSAKGFEVTPLVNEDDDD